MCTKDGVHRLSYADQKGAASLTVDLPGVHLAGRVVNIYILSFFSTSGGPKDQFPLPVDVGLAIGGLRCAIAFALAGHTQHRVTQQAADIQHHCLYCHGNCACMWRLATLVLQCLKIQ